MSPPDPPESAPGRRRLQLLHVPAGWRGAIREFVVIVAGVLAALGAQAWWEEHQEHERETEYLYQLLVDTRENEQRLAESIAEDSGADSAMVRTRTALIASGPPPPPDSLLQWLGRANQLSDFQPVVGTYRALLGTGDLRLIRTDSLRTLLTAYSASLDSEKERLEQLRGMVLDAVGPMARAMPFMHGMFIGGPDVAGVDVQQLRRDREVAAVLFTMQAANRNRLNGLKRLRDNTQRMRRALEAEPSLRFPATGPAASPPRSPEEEP